MSCARHVDRTQTTRSLRRRPVLALGAVLAATLGSALAVGPASLRAAPVVLALGSASGSASGTPEDSDWGTSPAFTPSRGFTVRWAALGTSPAEPATPAPTGPRVSFDPTGPAPQRSTPNPKPTQPEPERSRTRPAETTAPEPEPSEVAPAPAPTSGPAPPEPQPSVRPQPAAAPPATPDPTDALPRPSPPDQPRAGVALPDRVPAEGSQPRAGDVVPGPAVAEPDQPGWMPLLSSRDVGIRIFLAGLIALVIAIVGLVTVAVRRRHW